MDELKKITGPKSTAAYPFESQTWNRFVSRLSGWPLTTRLLFVYVVMAS